MLGYKSRVIMSQICSCPVDLYDFQHHTWYSQIKETKQMHSKASLRKSESNYQREKVIQRHENILEPPSNI